MPASLYSLPCMHGTVARWQDGLRGYEATGPFYKTGQTGLHAYAQGNAMLRFIVLLCVCPAAMAGLWSPPIFAPSVAPDGTRTWQIIMDVSDIRKEDRALPASERDVKIASYFMGWKRFCDSGWEVTSSRVDKKRLIIDGRCKP